MHRSTPRRLLTGIIAIGVCTGAHAQSTDALLNKLVQKGVLTTVEAEELKKEADNTKTASLMNHALPEWVTGLKLYGDVRARYDWIEFEDDAPVDRHRYRFRARMGLTALFKDNLEMGFRLTSAENDNATSSTLSQGGDPISGNVSFQNNASKKYTFIDAAYGRWSPVKNDDWTLTLTAGKMDNPLTFSDLVMDNDYTPEGASLQLSYKLNSEHSFKLAGVGFVIDESSGSSDDPSLVGGQMRWDAKWEKHLETTVGLAALTLSDTKNLRNGDVPNTNVGNTRVGGATTNSTFGLLVNNYNPLIADAAVIYTFDDSPIYKGRLPVRVFGTFLYNPSAPDANQGWEAGAGVGKAGKKGTWELVYRYRYLEADAIYEEFPDSDFGAFYSPSLAGSGKNAGYGAGTNTRGHTVRASYSPFDALLLSVTYSRVDLIRTGTASLDSDTGRLFADATWKF